MMQNFWVECHRLLYGIYLMQQHGVQILVRLELISISEVQL